MFRHSIASTLFLLALPTAGLAQRPPAFDAPRAWGVNDEAGPLPYELVIEAWYPDFTLGVIVFFDACIDTTTNRKVAEGRVCVPMNGDGTTLYSYSSDSQLWSRWVWAGDHYDKVGGSPAVRSYWPLR